MSNYKRILTERPVMFLMLVAVFSLIVGFSLVLQSDNALTYMSRASSRFENLQCPIGTTPLFKNVGLINEQNLGIPGSKILTSTGNWRIVKKDDAVMATNGRTLDIQFPQQMMITKVMVYGNDDRANMKKGPWTINGETIQGIANNKQPFPVELMNKGPFTVINFDSLQDNPNFNACLSVAPTNTPTPTKELAITGIPYISVTSTPSASITPPPVLKPITCDAFKAFTPPESTEDYFAVMPNNPFPYYYVTIYKNGTKVMGPIYGGDNTITNIPAGTLTSGTYEAYVSRKPNSGLSTGPNCEIAIPSLPVTTNIPTSIVSPTLKPTIPVVSPTENTAPIP